MPSAKCPVCGWTIKDPVKVKTAAGVVTVCCDECAEKAKAASSAEKSSKK